MIFFRLSQHLVKNRERLDSKKTNATRFKVQWLILLNRTKVQKHPSTERNYFSTWPFLVFFLYLKIIKTILLGSFSQLLASCSVDDTGEPECSREALNWNTDVQQGSPQVREGLSSEPKSPARLSVSRFSLMQWMKLLNAAGEVWAGAGGGADLLPPSDGSNDETQEHDAKDGEYHYCYWTS